MDLRYSNSSRDSSSFSRRYSDNNNTTARRPLSSSSETWTPPSTLLSLSRLSIQPGEDPFAPPGSGSGEGEGEAEHEQQEELGLGGEEWRISEEESGGYGHIWAVGEEAEDDGGGVRRRKGLAEEGGQGAFAREQEKEKEKEGVRRRSSLLLLKSTRSFLRRTSSSVSLSLSFARPSSPSHLRSATPHPSGIRTSDISAPLISSESSSFGAGVRRRRASLISLATAKERRRSWLLEAGTGAGAGGSKSLGAAGGRRWAWNRDDGPRRVGPQTDPSSKRQSQVGLALTTLDDSAMHSHSPPRQLQVQTRIEGSNRRSISTSTYHRSISFSAQSQAQGPSSLSLLQQPNGRAQEQQLGRQPSTASFAPIPPGLSDSEPVSSTVSVPPPPRPPKSVHRPSSLASRSRAGTPVPSLALSVSRENEEQTEQTLKSRFTEGLEGSEGEQRVRGREWDRHAYDEQESTVLARKTSAGLPPPRSASTRHETQPLAPPAPRTRPRSRQGRILLDTTCSSPTLDHTSKSNSQTKRRPLASLYLILGLPSSPARWVPAPHEVGQEHALNALPGWWRAEVLGGSKTGEGSDGEGVQEEWETMEKEEEERVRARVLKLAFPSDLEILASPSQPASRVGQFSFVLRPPSPPASAGQKQRTEDPGIEYHCTSLLIYSHADASLSAHIRATLSSRTADEQANGKTRTAAAQRKAASKSRKWGERLKRQMESPLGVLPDDEGGGWADGAKSETETEGGFVTESEWGDFPPQQRRQQREEAEQALAHLTPSTPFWLPYCLVLVSREPLYNLLTDILRISWARYHQDVASHALQMDSVLHFALPEQAGETIRLPVSVSNKLETFFVVKMPGRAGGGVDFAMWPVVRALSADSLLDVAEIALSPFGRVLFISRHAIMLNLAISLFRHILFPLGWSGVIHPSVHIRDLRIHLEDPGPWFIGISTLSRSVALADLAEEVVIVDLDTDRVECRRPPPAALSTGKEREKMRRRLETVIGREAREQRGVPSEVTEAFPGGRFRPFSEVEVGGVPKDAERLRAPSSWNWDQHRFITEFSSILAAKPRSGLGRFLPLVSKKQRRAADLDPSAKHVQSIVRKHAATFVDRRDQLEGKINKLNGKLAGLRAESSEWQKSFEVFKQYSDKLTKESMDLKTRLEKERREARRLTGQMQVEREHQTQLEASLSATEQAREQALAELSNVELVRANLEEQRTLLMSEMQLILSADESSPLYETVYARLETLSQGSSRPGSSLSRRSGSRLGRPSFTQEEPRGLAPLEEDDEEVLHTQSTAPVELGEEERLEAMKQAVQETLHSIQSRLSIVLQNAGQLDITQRRDSACSPTLGRSHLMPSHSTPILPDSPPSSHAHSPSQAEQDGDESFSTAYEGYSSVRSPRRFEPKPFQLSPPVSPELSMAGAAPFVTTERGGGAGRRTRHRNNDSITSEWTSESISAPYPTTPLRSFTPASNRTRTPSSELVHSRSFGQPGGSRRDSPSEQGDWDDGQSFASASEGFDLSRPGSVSGSLRSDENEEEAVEELDKTERIEGPHFPQSHDGARTVVGSFVRPAHHRKPSTDINSPPVELFTRAVSPLGSRRRDGSIDMGRRLAPERFAPWKAGGLPVKAAKPTSSAMVKPTRRM